MYTYMATRARPVGERVRAEADDVGDPDSGEQAEHSNAVSRRWNLLSTVAIFGGIVLALRIGKKINIVSHSSLSRCFFQVL